MTSENGQIMLFQTDKTGSLVTAQPVLPDVFIDAEILSRLHELIDVPKISKRDRGRTSLASQRRSPSSVANAKSEAAGSASRGRVQEEGKATGPQFARSTRRKGKKRSKSHR